LHSDERLWTNWLVQPATIRCVVPHFSKAFHCLTTTGYAVGRMIDQVLGA
jgi:hypothetical protein